MPLGANLAKGGQAGVHVERGRAAGNTVVGTRLVVEELVDIGGCRVAQVPHDGRTGPNMREERIELLDEITVNEAGTADGADTFEVTVQEEGGIAGDGAFGEVFVDHGGGAEAALRTGADGVVDLHGHDSPGFGLGADSEAR